MPSNKINLTLYANSQSESDNYSAQLFVEFEIAREQVGPLMGYLRDNGLGLADRSTVDEAIELARSDPSFLGFVKMTYFVALWQHTQIKPILDQAEATLLAVQDEIRGRT